MDPQLNDNSGPITRYLAEDHHRLEKLLHTAAAQTDHVDHEAYNRFRAGLLRHIGIEEKILLPAAQQLRGGEPLSFAAKLRLDHGAIAALLMPTPTMSIIAILDDILKDHNVIEEGTGGLYESCDNLARSDIEPLMVKLRASPEPAVMPYSDAPAVMSAVRRAVERAGYEFREGTS